MRFPKNIVQTTGGQAAASSATAKGRSAMRGRDKGKGGSFISDHSILFFARFLFVKVISYVSRCQLCILSICERFLVELCWWWSNIYFCVDG